MRDAFETIERGTVEEAKRELEWFAEVSDLYEEALELPGNPYETAMTMFANRFVCWHEDCGDYILQAQPSYGLCKRHLVEHLNKTTRQD